MWSSCVLNIGFDPPFPRTFQLPLLRTGNEPTGKNFIKMRCISRAIYFGARPRIETEFRWNIFSCKRTSPWLRPQKGRCCQSFACQTVHCQAQLVMAPNWSAVAVLLAIWDYFIVVFVKQAFRFEMVFTLMALSYVQKPPLQTERQFVTNEVV